MAWWRKADSNVGEPPKGMATVENWRERPRLHVFGKAFKSQKARLALRISTAWAGSEVQVMDNMGGNCRPEYARLSPDFTAPALEIDDKIITDSDLLCGYLREKYPGRGDQAVAAAGRVQELQDFCDQVSKWDGLAESCAARSPITRLADMLRNVRLRQNCQRLSDPAAKLWDGRTLQQVFEQKIAHCTRQSIAEGAEADAAGEEERRRTLVPELAKFTEQIFAAAQQCFVDAGGRGWLFGAELSTADAFFCPMLFQMFSKDKEAFEELLGKFPRLRDYWKRFCTSAEGRQAVIKYSRAYSVRLNAWQCIPCAILRLKMGCLSPPHLEPAVEERIEKLLNKA